MDTFLTHSTLEDSLKHNEAELWLHRGCHRFFVAMSVALMVFELLTFMLVVCSVATENYTFLDPFIFHAFNHSLFGFLGCAIIFGLYMHFLISGIIAYGQRNANQMGVLRFGWTGLAIYHIIDAFIHPKRALLVIICAVMARETHVLQKLFLEQAIHRLFTGDVFTRIV